MSVCSCFVLLYRSIIAVVGSLLFPDEYDFEETRALHAEEHTPKSAKPATALDSPTTENEDTKEKELQAPNTLLKSAQASIAESGSDYDENHDPRKLQAAFKLAVWVSVGLFVVLILCIPLPLFFSSYEFSKVGFTFWVAVTFIWVFCES